jgi:hypothetical protein
MGICLKYIAIKKCGGLCDSPLERGVGVCSLSEINTSLPTHYPPHPLSRGELITY